MNMCDTHCHLTDEAFASDYQDVLREAYSQGVSWIVTIGTGLDDIKKAQKFVQNIHSPDMPHIYYSGGLTPFDVPEAKEEDLKTLRELLLSDTKAIALGEIGLDYYWQYGDIHKEEHFYTRQIELAIECDLPIIVHCRDAHARNQEILKEYADYINDRVVIHSYSGTYADAVTYLDYGCFLSFTCALGYKSSAEQREIVKKIPLNRIMTETDAPYLPPAHKRGSRNESAHINVVVETIADIVGMSRNKVADILFENALQFLRINP